MPRMHNPYTPIKAKLFRTEQEAKECYESLPEEYGKHLKARELASILSPDEKYQQLHLFACATMEEFCSPESWPFSVVYRVE